MVTRGRKTGGRQPITPSGPAIQLGIRFPREVVADLEELSGTLDRPVADIVRDGTTKEVKRLKKVVAKRGGK